MRAGEKQQTEHKDVCCFTLLLLGKKENSSHINKHTHTHTLHLSDVEEHLYVGSCWLSAAGVIYPCLYGPALCHKKERKEEKKHWWVGFKEPYLLFQHQKVHLEASVIFHLFPQTKSYYDEQSSLSFFFFFFFSHPFAISQFFMLRTVLPSHLCASVLACSQEKKGKKR